MKKALLLLPAMLIATAAAAATPMYAAFALRVPEPGTMILLAAGAGMLGIVFRKKK
jgi:cobalamin biosynthesis protein CobD/CbiB